jgi:hypothetical protein
MLGAGKMRKRKGKETEKKGTMKNENGWPVIVKL